jgi:hypothetical protein
MFDYRTNPGVGRPELGAASQIVLAAAVGEQPAIANAVQAGPQRVSEDGE